jgi:hypothetical protein
MSGRVCELVIPDAGPLITLAYAGRLDLLLAIQAKLVVIDMVQIELTRHRTPTSQRIIDFIADNAIEIAETEIGKEAQRQGAAFNKRHAGERAIQDFLFDFYDENNGVGSAEKFVLLLFEDHKVSGTGFVLPENVYVISTRAFLTRLEGLKIISSAQEISNAAVTAGRNFSQREVDQPAKGAPDLKPF